MALEVVMSKEREMIEKLCSFQMTYSDWLLLIADAEELLAQPEQDNLTPRQGLEEYKKGYMIGYNVAVRDLKTKIDSVFNLIMEDEDDESDT